MKTLTLFASFAVVLLSGCGSTPRGIQSGSTGPAQRAARPYHYFQQLRGSWEHEHCTGEPRHNPAP